MYMHVTRKLRVLETFHHILLILVDICDIIFKSIYPKKSIK